MARSSEKRYLTGEFAKHFGVSKDTLLYYDKIGLFRPASVSPNGYRYYTAAQGEAFWALHSLRQMNVPIHDLRGYFAAPSPAALEQLAGAQLATVDAELTQLLRMRWLLTQMERATREARGAHLDVMALCKTPVQRLYYSAQNPTQDSTTDDEWSRQYEAFLAQMGLKGSAYIGSVLAQADLVQGQFTRVDRLFVRDEARLFGGARGSAEKAANKTVVRRQAAKPPRDKKPCAGVRPAGLFAVLYLKGNYKHVQQQYPRLLAQIAQQGLRICGDAYEEYLINELATPDEAQYMTKVSIAVED